MNSEKGDVVVLPEMGKVLPEMGEVWLQTLNWQPDARLQAQFQRFYDLIVQGNRQLNLTRITAPQEFWEKHLWDSLSGIKPWLDSSKQEAYSVIDIGTGAGFPGVPVAIVRPDWQVTLLDSTRKKLMFVDQSLTELGIENARTCVDRAEQVGHAPQHRTGYDLVLIRAVATASVCAEYAMPLLKIGGAAVLYRGQWTEAEAIGFQSALETLGGSLEQVEPFVTPLSQSVRHCVHLRKLKPTPTMFPRSIGIPKQKPL